ncbi:BatD family protein [Vibrio sonorensis]|uniref:BatD family protein n=1 Tax=Vibrio sonorensis TaxID=1004316 RepID=UPI000AEDF774|nr:BatD family protein [Vibrio sonorensis]
MKRNLKNYFVLLTLWLIPTLSMAATITATVSKTSVTKNEVFQLRIVADEKLDSEDIDFSGLESDFYVSRPSFGSSINIINGTRTNRSEWNVSLAALRIGTLTIPSFDIDGSKTQPIKIKVALNAQAPTSDDLVEFQSQLSTKTLYPQQSARLSSRLIIKGDPRRLQNLKSPLQWQTGFQSSY